MKFKYFTYKEFDCKGGQGKGENMSDDFICLLDDARELARIPFKITSGYRTPEYNKQTNRLWISSIYNIISYSRISSRYRS
jgi:hypothetical protein